MRVWLAAFVVLFAAIELFEWVMQLGSWQPTGMWLVLGGMGLAAISNFSHLPIGQPTANSAVENLDQDPSETVPSKTDRQQKATLSNQTVAQVAATKKQKVVPSLADESDKDSISFKVRPLKR